MGIFLAMLAALMTKGPILYAFIFQVSPPFGIWRQRPPRALIWSGWWTWLVPLAVVCHWLAIGWRRTPSSTTMLVVGSS